MLARVYPARVPRPIREVPNVLQLVASKEETFCLGPGSITGTVIDATTIITPRFSAYRCWAHSPVQITVQFKDPSAIMKVGDTATLKGSLFFVQDPHRNAYEFVLKNAELAQ